jgi:hypothetical protein
VLFLVLFGVAGPCIKTSVERMKNGEKREVLFLATALECTEEQLSALRLISRPMIERMPCQPVSHTVALASIDSTLRRGIFKAVTSDRAHLP